MLRIHHEHELITQNLKRFEVAVYRLISHQRKIQIAIEHLSRQAVRRMPKNLNHDVGVEGSIVENDVRQQIERGALVRANPDPSTLERLHLGNSFESLVAQGENALSVVIHQLAHLSKRRRLL